MKHFSKKSINWPFIILCKSSGTPLRQDVTHWPIILTQKSAFDLAPERKKHAPRSEFRWNTRWRLDRDRTGATI
jgi:hypothetical protein